MASVSALTKSYAQVRLVEQSESAEEQDFSNSPNTIADRNPQEDPEAKEGWQRQRQAKARWQSEGAQNFRLFVQNLAKGGIIRRSTNRHVDKGTKQAGTRSQWLPATLHATFLAPLCFISFGFGALIITWSLQSARFSGICDDSSNAGFLFAWRFLPTLIAVVYSLAVSTLRNDIRRTEVFARLSRPEGASADTTLFFSGSMWWNDATDAWKRSRNGGHRSWTLFTVSFLNIFAILLISPLSAGVFSPTDVQITQDVMFDHLAPAHSIGFNGTTTDETYYRTTASMIQNLTTSAWLNDSFAILPFWPADTPQIPLGAQLEQKSEQWSGVSTVFQAGMDCMPMKVSLPPVIQGQDSLSTFFNVHVASDDGCSLNYQHLSGTLGEGSGSSAPAAGWWSSTQSPYYPIAMNQTTACGGREVLVFKQPLNSSADTGQQISIAEICTPKIYAASNMNITVTNRNGLSTVQVDSNRFDKLKKEIDTSTLRLSEFDDFFLTDKWSSYVNLPGQLLHKLPNFYGPFTLLAATYGDLTNDLTKLDSLRNTADLLSRARRVRQRFLGEALQAALVPQESFQTLKRPVQVTSTRDRLLVGYVTGLLLGICLIISGILTIFIYVASRPSYRPLNLERDPASAAAVMMMTQGGDVRAAFCGLAESPESVMRTAFRGSTLQLVDNKLFVTGKSVRRTMHAAHGKALPSKPSSMSFPRQMGFSKATHMDEDWRPAVLRRWSGSTLVAYIIGLLVSIVVLFRLSQHEGLIRPALVYRSIISFQGNTTIGFAPFSIIPTVFAVALKLWWASLEDIYKRAQPYVAMAQRPTDIRQGCEKSYVNSPMVIASARAFRHKHWLLALVCCGALGTEIVTVGMSALWQRITITTNQIHSLPATLQVRAAPQIFQVAVDELVDLDIKMTVFEEVFANPFANWMYGAVTQLAYNGTPPAWTQDGWAFAPVDLTTLGKTKLPQNVQSNVTGAFMVTEQNAIDGDVVTATIDTEAVRARLQCNQLDLASNTSWVKSVDLRNTSMFDPSKNPTNLDVGYELSPEIICGLASDHAVRISTTVLPDNYRLACCTNTTDGVTGQTAVGYWTPSLSAAASGEAPALFAFGQEDGYPRYVTSETGNLTVKWIVGVPTAEEYTAKSKSAHPSGYHYMWVQQPSMTATNCAPIFEKANASVTVNVDTGQVLTFQILNTPQVDPAATSDLYSPHNTFNISQLAHKTGMLNLTVSYGALFQSALLNSVHSAETGGVSPTYGDGGSEHDRNDSPIIRSDYSTVNTLISNASTEDLGGTLSGEARTFRMQYPGLNVDFMSYCLYAMSGRNATSLLDIDLLTTHAQTVYSTFFLHFATFNSSLAAGGRVFQPIGQLLPTDLTPVVNVSRVPTSNGTISPSAYQDIDFPSYTNRNTTAILHRRVYQLQMSIPAVVICLVVLVYLILVALLVYGPYAVRFKALPRDVETLASIIALIHDSPNLRKWVAQNEPVLFGEKEDDVESDIPDGDGPAGDHNLRASARTRDSMQDVKVGLGRFNGEFGSTWGVELEPVIRAQNSDPRHYTQNSSRKIQRQWHWPWTRP